MTRSFNALILSLLLAACHRPDFTESVTPVAATSLSLVSQARAESTYVDITLGGGTPASIGSFTGEVVHEGDWTFVACDAQQPQALLACKEHGSTLRIAAAWAAGTHAGALVRLRYVRRTPMAVPRFTFVVSEAHGARGVSLLDSLEVRRTSVVSGGDR